MYEKSFFLLEDQKFKYLSMQECVSHNEGVINYKHTRECVSYGLDIISILIRTEYIIH